MPKIHDVDQRSEAWFALRCGVPTASEFSKLITSTGEPSKSASGYALTLAGEMFAGKPLESWEGNLWTERGNELELAAIQLYEFTNEATTQQVGFVTHDTIEAGCSPDRLVGDDGLLEIKCLKPERHIEAIVYFQKHGRCKPDYVQQTQGQLLITGRKWVDLYFYSPDLPVLTVRQEPDRALQMALLSAIPKVCKERDEIVAALHRQAGTVAKAA
ncbi:MAG: YqaJ viral recombinase family protein [Sulfuricaulis sp.]|nr:YqaJ viral recombinase family protein [Sulfuricaulis sp.]